jgi:ectoine hydroxylase-related dioxygenase (phytanoyl-CoA dioxygenase family)
MATGIDQLFDRQPQTVFDATLPEHAGEEFDANGFFTLDRITTDEEVAWLREVYDVFFSGEAGAYVLRDVSVRLDQQRGDRISQIVRPENYLPALRNTQFWRNSRKLALQLLHLSDTTSVDGWGHMVRKAPRDTEVVPWHQDEGYWDPAYDYLGLGVWMPLDPATVESGCMSMIPGSHKGEVLEHKHTHGDPAVSVIVCDDFDASRAVPRPVPVGGASFHHCRTLHWSGPNRADFARRAYVNEWQTTPVQRTVPHDRPWWGRRQEAMGRFAKDRLKPAVTN